HHDRARSWFSGQGSSGWATCPLTESGFVRVSSNPVLPHAATPADAMSVLELLRGLPGHEFWADDVSLVASDHVDRTRIASYRHVTDAHLVALARGRGARLATLDGELRRLLSRGRADISILVIGGRS
ncbi:MAG: TA system VapC family ribonuclease toxin, partial [Acidimicrobiales bacterium]